MNLTWYEWLLWAFVVTQLTILSVTIYLHRAQAHRALEVAPFLDKAFRLWLWLTTGMSTREWVAVHRKHHAHCETVQDPHSPQQKGLWKVLFQGAWLYRQCATTPGVVESYGRGAPDDALERWIRRHSWKGPVLLVALNGVLLGPVQGLAMSVVQLVWIPFWAAGVINGLAHYAGYRNFSAPDASRNLLPWGLWIGGEELHNNHHAHPTSAKLSYQSWELDIGWGVILLLQALGWVRVKQVVRPPRLHREPLDLLANWEGLKARQLLVARWMQKAWQKEMRRLKLPHALRRQWARGWATKGTNQAFPPTLVQLRTHWFELQKLWQDPSASLSQVLERLQIWRDSAQQCGGAVRQFGTLVSRLGHA